MYLFVDMCAGVCTDGHRAVPSAVRAQTHLVFYIYKKKGGVPEHFYCAQLLEERIAEAVVE